VTDAASRPADDDPEPEPVVEPEPVAESVPEGQPEPVAESVPEGQPEPVAESVPEGQPEPVAESVPEGQPESVLEDHPEPVPAAVPVLPPPPPELADVPPDAGRIVAGTVRELSGDDAIVDLDDGRTGVINRRNLGADAPLEQVLSVGQRVEGAILARSDPKHRVVLSRSWALKKRAWEVVAGAAERHETLTGRVVSIAQKGVVVDVGVRGFVPASHLELQPVSDLSAYADRELDLRVLDVDVERERLVLSRRSLLLREQRRSLHDLLVALTPGEVRRGRVSSLSDYGAFVDLGGVNGLVHVSELAWQRLRHPSDAVAVGDEVDVLVLDVKVKKRRVSLSIRQLTDDPMASIEEGQLRTGPVTRLVDFGAFVDLSGVEGLVHVSELAEYRVSAPEEVVAPGEEVRVKVLSVDRRRRRVELSIRQAAEFAG
jgi:small subunit ribosomal protein S1